MPGKKKYPHVPCDSVVLRLDLVVVCLEKYLEVVCRDPDGKEMAIMTTDAIEGLGEVIARRGKVLTVQRRRRGMSGTFMTVR